MARPSGLEFCCFAVPLINFGSYLIALEFIFVSTCIVVLALAPPPIVAGLGVLPSWFKWVLLVLAAISIALQLGGIISIARQSTALYRAYIRINFALTVTVIVIATIGTVVMATGHEKATRTCLVTYGNEPLNSGNGFRIDMLSDALKDSGKTICNVFTYVQLGAIGGLIALIGLTQLYMCYCQRKYGQYQRSASDKQDIQPDHDYGDRSTDKFDLSSSSASSFYNPHGVSTSRQSDHYP